MRPVRYEVTTTGTTAIVPLDIYIAPFQVAVNVLVPGGVTTSYTLQYTYDDVLAVGYDPAAPTSQWIDDTTMSAEVASSGVNLTAPVTAIRLSVPTLTGGNIKLTVVQAGNGL